MQKCLEKQLALKSKDRLKIKLTKEPNICMQNYYVQYMQMYVHIKMYDKCSVNESLEPGKMQMVLC